jgi:hypothetical protein
VEELVVGDLELLDQVLLEILQEVEELDLHHLLLVLQLLMLEVVEADLLLVEQQHLEDQVVEVMDQILLQLRVLMAQLIQEEAVGAELHNQELLGVQEVQA